MKKLSLRFRLCNLTFGDALRQAMAFGMIKLNNILKFNICESRLDLMDYEDICAIFNELLRVVYGIESRSLYFNEEGCYEEEVHDEESGKLTIKTVDRRNSPWNSKIFGFYNL